jgi:hypothetical protein
MVHYGGWDGGEGFCGDCWEWNDSHQRLDMVFLKLNRVHVVKDKKNTPLGAQEQQVEVQMDAEQYGRLGHSSCVVDDTDIYIFGGMTLDLDCNDMWYLRTNAKEDDMN